VKLSAAKQDEVIAALEAGKATGFTWPSAQAFFNTVRTHTMEGMFADPVYGGNKDFAGWVLVGFPGAQPLFSPADLQSRDAFAGAPIIGLQAQSKAATRRT
jgi:gluconate 2-dehydrogenase gamma chain